MVGMIRMKKTMCLCLLAAGLLLCPAGNAAVSFGAACDQVASEDEKVAAQEVGLEGMIPVDGSDVSEGVYDVEVECSSSMFRIEKAVLTVKDGKMEAALTLSGTGYLKLFMGTGLEAAADDGSSYIDYVEEEEGKYTFTIPVKALDKPIECAAFSKRKEKWYDRTLLFEAQSLPEGAVTAELPDYEALKKAARDKRIAALKAEKESAAGAEAESAEKTSAAEGTQAAEERLTALTDGDYTVEITLEGGTGRAAVESPAKFSVHEGETVVQIAWSSSNYDYMIADGRKYLPVNTEGNSVFALPLTVLDEEVLVTADTTAMSTPHEVEYMITFHGDTIKAAESPAQPSVRSPLAAVAAAAGILILCAAAFLRRKKQ